MIGLARGRRRWVALVFVAACRSASNEPPDLATSPQAKAEPAPLATVALAASATAAAAGADAGPAPEPLRSDEALPADVPREPVREPISRDGGKDLAREGKEAAGFSLQAVVRTGEGPAAPRAPEVNAAVIETARRKTEARMVIDFTPARARLVLSGAFVVPAGTELRARVDRYGHLVLWAGESTYRVAEPGSLRALLGERRLDVAPLATAEVRAPGEGPRRLGLRTRRLDVSTRAAKASFEVATVTGAGDGGALLCRFLLDLMGAAPSTRACGADDVPVHAELHWTTRGTFVFDVTSLQRRIDLSPQELSAPPASLAFTAEPPPADGADVIVSRAELAAFRAAPADVPVATARDAAPPPESGLVLVNSSDELRIAWIDGVPAAWVAAGARLALPAMLRGRYALQWRTFLGDGWEAPDLVVAPGVSEVGGAR